MKRLLLHLFLLVAGLSLGGCCCCRPGGMMGGGYAQPAYQQTYQPAGCAPCQ